MSEEQECAKDGESTRILAAADASLKPKRKESSPSTPSSTCQWQAKVLLTQHSCLPVVSCQNLEVSCHAGVARHDRYTCIPSIAVSKNIQDYAHIPEDQVGPGIEAVMPPILGMHSTCSAPVRE